MPVDHYENFPVASILLPRRVRRPVELIYRFAREADDFADEGVLLILAVWLIVSSTVSARVLVAMARDWRGAST